MDGLWNGLISKNFKFGLRKSSLTNQFDSSYQAQNWKNGSKVKEGLMSAHIKCLADIRSIK